MRTLIFLLLFVSLSAHAADDSTKTYDFLNQVIAQYIIKKKLDTNVCYIADSSRFLYWERLLFNTDTLYTYSTKVKSPISKRDSISIMRATKNYKNTCFNPQKLNNTVVVSSKQMIEIMKELNIKNGFYFMSFPIFFDKGNKALFFCDYHCGGLCGGGGVSIYENRKGVWTRTILLSGWEY